MTPYKSTPSVTPVNEADRVAKLHQYEITDESLTAGFETIAVLAATLFDTTHARISFVDQDQVLIRTNLDVPEMVSIPRKQNLCGISILNKDVTVIHNLPVTETIRFYVAAPIITTDGFALGTISVTDLTPHPSTSKGQLKMLQLLAGMIMDQLDAQLANRKKERSYQERLRRVSHDLKNPVTTISLYAQLLGNQQMTKEKVFSMAGKIENSCKGINAQLTELAKQH